MRFRQQGSLMLMVILLLVVFGLLAGSSGHLFVAGARSNADQVGATQALFLAESGIEKGSYGWLQNPSTYTGEGPVALARGSFTVTTANTDFSGVALPAGQKRIISVGQVSGGSELVQRTAEVIISSGFSFQDSFPNINNWLTVGPTGDTFNRACSGTDNVTAQTTGGAVAYDSANTAPGSPGGSLRVQVSGANSRMTGYRQYTFPSPISAGTAVNLRLSFYKNIGTRAPLNLMMAVDLAATDNTVYRLWSDCGLVNTAWAAVGPFAFTVPAGKTINRIRLGFDIRLGTKNATHNAYFDEVQLTSASSGTLAWRENTP